MDVNTTSLIVREMFSHQTMAAWRFAHVGTIREGIRWSLVIEDDQTAYLEVALNNIPEGMNIRNANEFKPALRDINTAFASRQKLDTSSKSFEPYPAGLDKSVVFLMRRKTPDCDVNSFALNQDEIDGWFNDIPPKNARISVHQARETLRSVIRLPTAGGKTELYREDHFALIVKNAWNQILYSL